jgi:hypothetical protein
VVVLALASCDWSLHRMQDQPRCDRFAATDLLPGGACAIQPPDGVVAWQAAEPPPPPPLTRAVVDRGRDRFERFCAPCHGVAGDGDADVARVMTLRKPPSLVDAKVTGFSDDRIVTVIATGYGLMPAYASAVPLADRYAILYFLRALQRREIALDALPPDRREEAMRWLR